MEEEILKAILQEMKGMRQDIEALRKTTDERLDALQKTTDRRLDALEQGLAGIRYELGEIKDFLSERVIWNNDTISIDAQDGTVVHGVIHKGAKK
jgi:hypothetical protein